MFFTSEFPICDARDFTDSERRLSLPPWPFPEPGKHFVRCFGPVRRRARGGHPVWADEIYYASAHRAVRYVNLNQQTPGSCLRWRGATRRLFSDGTAIVRLEIGLSHGNRVAGLSGTEILSILRDYLDMPLFVRSYCSQPTTCRLALTGENTARLYEQATAVDGTINNGKLVTAARPVLLVEYTGSEIGSLPFHIRSGDPRQFGGVQLAFLWYEHRGRELGVWFLCNDGVQPHQVRALRMGLVRLHAEHQVLKTVLLHLARGELEYQAATPAADRLDAYLNKATRVLYRANRDGLALEGIRSDLLAYEEVGEPAERTLLLEKLKSIRRQIRKKVEAHLDQGWACQEVRREERPQPPCSAYRGPEAYTFVSYAHKDAHAVYPEIARLDQQGYRLWYDEGIDPGTTWPKRLGDAIDGCVCFLVFISPHAVMSRHCLDEIHFALERGKPFVAIHLEDTQLPNELALQMNRHQAIKKPELSQEHFLALIERALPANSRKLGPILPQAAEAP
jgi:hypothetical protein